MSKTIFLSRAVSESGYYEIDFNTLGITLTQLTKEELNEIPFTHWAYMHKNQYIEGSDINNWQKKPVYCILNDGQVTTEMDEYQLKNNHVCQYKEYHGLFEVSRICSVCGQEE